MLETNIIKLNQRIAELTPPDEKPKKILNVFKAHAEIERLEALQAAKKAAKPVVAVPSLPPQLALPSIKPKLAALTVTDDQLQVMAGKLFGSKVAADDMDRTALEKHFWQNHLTFPGMNAKQFEGEFRLPLTGLARTQRAFMQQAINLMTKPPTKKP